LLQAMRSMTSSGPSRGCCIASALHGAVTGRIACLDRPICIKFGATDMDFGQFLPEINKCNQ